MGAHFPLSPITIYENKRNSGNAKRIDAVEFSPPTEPHQQGPDLHEDSSPWATTRQRNTKDLRPRTATLEDSSLGAARDDRSTRVHGAAASRAELGRGARGEDSS